MISRLPAARENFLPTLGELNLSLDRGKIAIDRFRSLDTRAATLLWQPDQRLSISASASSGEELAPLDLLTEPAATYDNVRAFDFLRGETVDVSVVTGGNAALLPLTKTSRRLSINGAAWPRYSLQLNLDYEETSLRDFVSAVPAASSAIFNAFPERFQRDASGRLTLIDSRPTNFDREERRELRYGISFLLPVGGPKASIGGDRNAAVSSFRPAAADSVARLQVTASHSIALRDDIVIRDGLPVVDLLNGGAIGIGGGRARHLANASAALTGKGYGLRLTGSYRSGSSTFSGAAAAPERLRFGSTFTASARAFVEFGEWQSGTPWLRDTRLSLTIDNLTGTRQRVTDASGMTPLRFESAYRNSVGRTIELELRKVF